MNNSIWENEAAKMFREGKSYNEIARVLHKERHTVSAHLRALGYQTPEDKISHNKTCKYDYSYAETVFNKIDNEQSAYWLGFLYADGYVSTYSNTVSLALKESDVEHIEKFRDFMQLFDKPLQKKTKKLNGKTFISYSFSLNSARIKSQLVKLGCGPCKSLTLKFPTYKQVPKRFIRHFVRGYVDGDGSVTTSSCSRIMLDVAGTYDFLDQYQKWTGLGQNKIHQQNNIYRSMYAGCAAIYILDNLYKDASIYLERKYKRYLELRRLRLTTVRRPKSIIAELSKKGLTDPDLRLKALVAEAARSSATHSS